MIIIYHKQAKVIPEMQGRFNIRKYMYCIYYINLLKEKNQLIISKYAEKHPIKFKIHYDF